MSIQRPRSRTIAAVAGALALLPATAVAHPQPSPASVAAHAADAADALDRAEALVGSAGDGAALRGLRVSRAAIAQATSEADLLTRRAKDPAARARAARALALVAVQRDERVEDTAELLGPAGPAAERAIARGLLAEMAGRDRAVAVLGALADRGVPAPAAAGIARAVAAVAGDASEETELMAGLASGDEVSPATAVTLAAAVERNLHGLERAAALIGELKERLPEAAGPGLDRALAAIAAEREDAVSVIEEAAGNAPEAVRSRLEAVAERAAAAPSAAPSPSQPGVPAPTGPR